MGLKERQFVQQFQETRHNELTAQIQQAAGIQVPVEPDWDSLGTEEGMGHLFDQAFTNQFYVPTAAALGQIAADDLGKQAIASGLKKVVFQNTKGNTSMRDAVSFEDGVLVIDHRPVVNIPNPSLGENGDTNYQSAVKYIVDRMSEKL